MDSNYEIVIPVLGVILGIIAGGAIVYFFSRKNIDSGSSEALKLEFESTRSRLQTELASSMKVIEEKNQLNISKDSQIGEITRQLNQTLTALEVSNDRLQNISAEYTKTLEKTGQLETELQNLKMQLADSTAGARVLAESLNEQRLENNLKEAENLDFQRTNTALGNERAALLAKLNAAEEKLATQKVEIENIRQKSHLEFENIANRLLEDKSEKFTESNRSNIENILGPLKNDINLFKSKVEETYDRESKQRFSLEKEVKALIEQTDKVSSEANNLATALKGQAKTQGIWGEMILERILEINGLVRGRDYDVQHSIKNDEGNQQFLDVIVHLPDNRKLIIDSKVTLVAYDRYCASETDEDRKRFLKDHLQALTTHIDQLSRKKYDDLDASPDFVMLFVSIEPAYLMAIQHDSQLWARAYDKKILLISPTNLMAAVKMVSDLWRRDNQSKNADEIARQGEKLYDKFIGFLTTMESVGKHIVDTQEAFNKAIGQLKHGKGNLVGRAEKLKGLGLKTSKTLPPNMINYDEHDELADAASAG